MHEIIGLSERVWVKPRNGKVLIHYQGIYWTEEAFEQVHPALWAEIMQTAGV